MKQHRQQIQTQQLNKAVQDLSINSEALKAFTETFVRATKVIITVADMAKEMKQSNHEAWHKCSACGDWFDRKKDESCPSCGKNDF